MKAIRLVFTLMVASLLLAGCASTQTQSGFMSSYEGFKEREWSDGAKVHIKPGTQLKDMGKYTKFMFTPLEIWMDKNSSYQGIDPNEMKYVTDQFMAKFKATFGADYPIVTEPGPDVLLIRAAITGVERAAPERSALGYIPIALLVSAGKKAVDSAQGEEVIVYRAALEAELFDSVSGERLYAMIDQRTTEEQTVPEGQKNIQMIDEVLDYWMQRFKRNWDKAHKS